MLIPYRSFNINDIISNIAGVLAGALVFAATLMKREQGY
jgi:glycopeptide antibiotics resistance protein